MKILTSSEIIHQQLKSSKTGESYSLSAVLSKTLDCDDLFISHEVIEPGVRSSAPHFHSKVDEVVYVLKGQVIAREGEKRLELSTGDSLCFQANSRELHYLLNESSTNAEVLVIRKAISEPDVHFADELSE